MSAAEALKAARDAGIELALDGDDLVLSAASAPAPAVLDVLSRHKAGIVALLRPGRDGWSAEDWQVYFDERAGIAEFDGGLPRAEAEARAFECCVVEWLNRNPVCSPPGRCLRCGGREDTHDKLLPYGTEPTGHAWLHSLCWEAWHANRKAKAVAILSLILRAGWRMVCFTLLLQLDSLVHSRLGEQGDRVTGPEMGTAEESTRQFSSNGGNDHVKKNDR